MLTFGLLIALFQVLLSSTLCEIILIAAVPKIFSTSVSALFVCMLHVFKTNSHFVSMLPSKEKGLILLGLKGSRTSTNKQALRGMVMKPPRVMLTGTLRRASMRARGAWYLVRCCEALRRTW